MSFPKTLYVQHAVLARGLRAVDSLNGCDPYVPRTARYVLVDEGMLQINRQFIPTDKETDPNG